MECRRGQGGGPERGTLTRDEPNKPAGGGLIRPGRKGIRVMNTSIIPAAHRVSRIAAWAGGGILLLTSVLITVEVVLRKVFTISMGGADEISSYAMAVSCSFGFAFALFQKAHIRIDVVYNKCPRMLKHVLDIASLAFLGAYMMVLSYFGFKVFWVSFTKGTTANTPLHTPLWIPQLAWTIGLWGFTLAILLLLSATLFSLLKKDAQTAAALAGAATLKEEIQKETADTNDTDAPAPQENSGSGGTP